MSPSIPDPRRPAGDVRRGMCNSAGGPRLGWWGEGGGVREGRARARARFWSLDSKELPR